MRTVAIIIARMGSTRLPGKVLMYLGGNPVLEWCVFAAENAPGVNQTIVATTTLRADDAIVNWCKKNGVQYFRGSESNVLSRFAGAAKKVKADIVVRLTGDCPFADYKVIGEVIRL